MAKQNINTNGSPAVSDIQAKDFIKKVNLKNKSDLDRIGIITQELNPARLSHIFQGAARPGEIGQLLELYHKIEKYDSKIGGLVQKRRKAPTRFDTEIKIKNKDIPGASEAAEKLDAVISDMNFKELKRKTVNGIIYGTYLMESRWFSEGDWIVFGDPEEISPSRYGQFNDVVNVEDPRAGHLYIKNSHYSKDRIFVKDQPMEALYRSIYEEKVGFYDTAGIMRPIAKWYLFKYFTYQYWVEYNETYGFPTTIVTVPKSDYYTYQDELEELMQNVGRNKFGILFDGMDYKIHAQQSNGQVEFFRELVKRVNDEIVFGLLGTNLQEGGNNANYASSVVGYDMETDLIIDDSEFVDERINKNLVKPFNRANFSSMPTDNVYLHTNTPERKDWKKIEKKWEIAAKLGLKGVSKKQIQDDLEIKFAEDAEDSIDLSWDVKKNGGEHPDPEKRSEEREDGGSVADEE